jgi:hypothetical protein
MSVRLALEASAHSWSICFSSSVSRNAHMRYALVVGILSINAASLPKDCVKTSVAADETAVELRPC